MFGWLPGRVETPEKEAKKRSHKGSKKIVQGVRNWWNVLNLAGQRHPMKSILGWSMK